MQLSSKSFEVIRGPEIFIQAVKVLLPVAMVGLAIASVLRQVLDNRRNPNLVMSASDLVKLYKILSYGSEAHALDVVQLVDDSLVPVPIRYT